MKDWGVSRAGIAQKMILEIHIDVGSGDEVLGEFAAQGKIQTRQNLARLRSMVSLSLEGDLEHGGNERRGKAMAGNIGDEDADVLLVNLNEIVKIAGDGSHGKKSRGDLETGKRRNRVWEDRELDLSGHLEFIVEREKLLGELRASFPKEDVAAHAGSHDGGGKRLVDVIYGADFKATGFVFGAGLAGQKDDRDLRGRRIGLEPGAHLVAVHARHHDV